MKHIIGSLIVTACSLGILTNNVVAVADEEKTSEKDHKIIPINAFVAESLVNDVRLSPDGKSIVYVMNTKGESYLMVADLTDNGLGARSVLMSVKGKLKKTHRIGEVYWASDDRLLIKMHVRAKIKGTRYKVWGSVLYSSSRDGKDIIELRTDGSKAGQSMRHFSAADIINVWRDDPNHVLVSKPRNKNWAQNYQRGEVSDVYKLNIYNGDMQLYMKSPKISGVKLNDWFSDQGGNIRFGYGEDRKGKSVMVIRGENDEDWKRLSDNELFEEGKFSPLMFGSGPNEFYVLSSLATGRDAIFKFDISSGELDGKIYEHDEVDVSSLVYSYTDAKPLAAIYHDGKREKVFFDKKYKATIKGLEKALQTDVLIISRSSDEKNMIVLSQSDREPGSFYHYNVDKKSLSFLGTKLPDIEINEMAEVKPMSFMARDGVQISGYVTLPLNFSGEPLPTIIIPHADSTGRDYWGWQYTAQFLANRGYVVVQPNYRGSAGYGDRFASLGHGEWGGDMQKDLVDAVYWAVDEGYAKEDSVCILGRLYGGYAALMGASMDPDAYRCAISWSGVSDLKLMFKDDGVKGTKSAYYRRVAGDKKKKELSTLSPIHYTENVSAPILLMHGEDDTYHSIKQSQRFAKALKKAKKSFAYYEFPEVRHNLNSVALRRKYLEIVEQFLLKNNPTDTLLYMEKEKMLGKSHKPTQAN
ncbi:S9 family peptidase [Kordiimonas sp. SCSIO 12610]|uniref:alpha/beta hydrolase family protein n=1 Tax=Kordiimonas sp. SCSIO 12610 TaxID=2829597 RepID=UPI00210E5D2F|nr:prolyl oligopeptidase family serine peptidase [Kordiimonas sp. SCSIO 12610]UTW54745.1 S9 family peptidase [Kordiimonas sp. SCSIO 12610]